MLHAKFKSHRSIESGEEDFEIFYHIWAWRTCWSCDLDGLYIFLFSLPLDALLKFGFNWPNDI